jgi:hypothetical protein
VGLKLKGTHQLVVYADDMILLGDNIDSIINHKNSKFASKEFGVEVNVEKTKCMLLFHHQNAGQTHDMNVANRSFENVAQFKYLRTTVTNQNLIQTEIKRRLNSSNACYHSVQNLLSSPLMSEKVKIKIYDTIILLVVLYGCATWSLTLG